MSERGNANGTLLGLPPAELAAKFFEKRPTARRIDTLVGTTLAGRYLVEEKVGEGGMATVFRGRHLAIRKQVAIKVLDPALHIPDAVERFLQEAQATSLIRHEHVVEVTDFGATEDNVVFSVMELLSGETLQTTLESEGKLEPRRAAGIMRQICLGLHAAHQQGVIHRDLKPENCFRAPRTSSPDFIKVLDFGIAKVDAAAATALTAAPRKTQVGMVVGTPAYMAPEQARAEACDARSDVYSAGILLYQMLAGAVPFDKPTTAELLAQQMYDEPPPLLERDPTLPPSLCAVVERAMQKQPEARFASMEEMVLAIDRALEAGEAFATGANVIYEPTLRGTADEPAKAGPSRLPWLLGLGVGTFIVAGAVALGLSAGSTSKADANDTPASEAANVVKPAVPEEASRGVSAKAPRTRPPIQPEVDAPEVDDPSPVAPAEEPAEEPEPSQAPPEEEDEPVAATPAPARTPKPKARPKPKSKPTAKPKPPEPQGKDPDRAAAADGPGGKISEVKNPFDD